MATRIKRSRLASPADLTQYLSRPALVEPAIVSASAGGPSAPRGPAFLSGLPGVREQYDPRQPVTQSLRELVEVHGWHGAFKEAIDRVVHDRVPELDRIKSLDQFFFYVDALVCWIPEIRTWTHDGQSYHERTPYLRITQFYYYFNQPTLRDLQSPIEPGADTDLTPLSLWLREFAVAWGAFLDTPNSAKLLASFKWAPEYAWQDYERKPEEYETFNAYFGRCFRDIDAIRPVASASDNKVIVFPAESTFVGQWAIGTRSGEPLSQPPSIVVKHVEWPIEELLKDSAFGDAFAGGLLCHSFLNTFDYHRQHAPVGGTIVEARLIAAQVYLKVTLDELDPAAREAMDPAIGRAVFPHRYLDAQDETGYQFVQCRGLIVIDSPVGKVAVLPMGMAQVSSVVFVEPQSRGSPPIVLTAEEKRARTYDEQVALVNERLAERLVGQTVSKGEMLSYFQFGGSDIVTVFERRANVCVSATVGTHYPVRSQFAVSNINS